jgi:hypothetical protein
VPSQGNVDRVSQVQVEACVLALDHPCCIQDLKAVSGSWKRDGPAWARTKSMIAVRARDPELAWVSCCPAGEAGRCP